MWSEVPPTAAAALGQRGFWVQDGAVEDKLATELREEILRCHEDGVFVLFCLRSPGSKGFFGGFLPPHPVEKDITTLWMVGYYHKIRKSFLKMARSMQVSELREYSLCFKAKGPFKKGSSLERSRPILMFPTTITVPMTSQPTPFARLHPEIRPYQGLIIHWYPLMRSAIRLLSNRGSSG